MNDPNSYEGKKFRMRLRVPFSIFHQVLVPQFISENIFETKSRSQIGVEFKILICLRILGRGHDFDTVNEISLIPTSTCHYIFKKFVNTFADKLFDRYVHMPEGDELKM